MARPLGRAIFTLNDVTSPPLKPMRVTIQSGANNLVCQDSLAEFTRSYLWKLDGMRVARKTRRSSRRFKRNKGEPVPTVRIPPLRQRVRVKQRFLTELANCPAIPRIFLD